MQYLEAPTTELHLEYKINDLSIMLNDLQTKQVSPFEVLISLEQRNNALRRGVFPKNFDEQYMPRQSLSTFEIPYISPMEDSMEVFQTADAPSVSDIKLFVHPLWAKSAGIRVNGYAICAPSSSTRTVFLIDEDIDYPTRCVKTHLPLHIGPFRRGLSKDSIQHGISITNELANMNLPDKFSFLKETIGVSVITSSVDFGCVYRELKPHPYFTNGESALIPMFSLYSPVPEIPNSNGKLLEQLLYRNGIGGESIEETFTRVLIEPFIANWFWCLRNTGILLEPHGQNALIEVGYDGRVRRFVYRDFQGLRIINPVRKRLGLKAHFARHVLDDEKSVRESLGLVYDSYMSDYLIRNMVNALTQLCNINRTQVCNRITEIFHHHSGEYEDLFYPYKLRTIIDGTRQRRFSGGDVVLERCGTPEFR